MLNSKIKFDFLFLILLGSLFYFFVACNKNTHPILMDSGKGLQELQKDIEKLANGNQVDSVCIRSTNRKSQMSSIYILLTDEKDKSEYKKVVEYIPSKDLNLIENSKTKKDALHTYKVNLASLSDYIENCKQLLPEGCSYKDVHSIRYSATPFGEKYYITLEVELDNDNVVDDYIDVFYDPTVAIVSEKSIVSDKLPTYHTVTFLLEEGQLNMMKASN